MESQDFIISTQNLTKQFGGVTAVDHINLNIPPGTIMGFIGPSGCGKTTTVRLLLGLYAPTEGEVQVLGERPQAFTRRTRANIGYMAQQFVLYPELNVWENLNFAASLYGVPLRRKALMQDLLALVELTGHEKKQVIHLSGGMQRRLSLAASLIHQPNLLFLDEPTAGIDPVLRRKFWDFFQELKVDGRTLFVTTQYVGEAAYCDYVGVMAEGRLLMVETPDGLRRRALGGEILHVRPTEYLPPAQMATLREQPFVLAGQVNRLKDGILELVVDEADTALPQTIDWFQAQNIAVESANEYVPPYDDLFVQIIEQEMGRNEK
jgi:ABC-2 type transport system ATP-binding protein